MRLVVIGAGGRLGRLIVAEGERAGIETSSVGRADDLQRNLKAPGVNVAVDVSTPGSTLRHVQLCADHGVALVVGTTGLSDEDQQAVDAAARRVPILLAANLSPGAHLVALFAGMAAKAMADADVEVVEVHHRKKKDAPSGTALMLAQAVAQARTSSRLVRSRDGVALREAGDIGVVAVRGGDVVGEHTVSFFVDGERVELVHKVSDRAIFAKGAVLAARYLLGRAPGRYHMADVLQSSLSQGR